MLQVNRAFGAPTITERVHGGGFGGHGDGGSGGSSSSSSVTCSLVRPTGAVTAGASVSVVVDVDLTNQSTGDQEHELELVVGGTRVARDTFRVPPGTKRERLRGSWTARSGSNPVSVELINVRQLSGSADGGDTDFGGGGGGGEELFPDDAPGIGAFSLLGGSFTTGSRRITVTGRVRNTTSETAIAGLAAYIDGGRQGTDQQEIPGGGTRTFTIPILYQNIGAPGTSHAVAIGPVTGDFGEMQHGETQNLGSFTIPGEADQCIPKGEHGCDSDADCCGDAMCLSGQCMTLSFAPLSRRLASHAERFRRAGSTRINGR